MKRTSARSAQIFKELRDEILSGCYSKSCRFPSEAALAGRFDVSRSTMTIVVSDLERLGLVTRQQGRGTFVTKSAASRKIGLIVPGVVYSEFFPPIVSEISRLAQENKYALLFADVSSGNPKTRARQARAFASFLVKENVSGVIFQPLEFLDDADRLNREIAEIFAAAEIPVVLLDSDIVFPPERSGLDVVGINNSDAGYRLAEHLLAQGARKIHFQMRPNWASSVRNRLRGVVTALGLRGLKCSVLTADPEDLSALRRHLRRGRPEAFVCGNDTAAAKFRQTLEKAGLRVPDDVLLAAFDDVQIASILSPPLTTIRQPCKEIGATLFNRLMERIAKPDLLPAEILLPSPLVVRASTRRRGGRP